MTNLVKAEQHALDGFETYEDGIEGDEQSRSQGVIQGSFVKFTNDAAWILRDGEELPPDLELAVMDIGRVVQRWKDQIPIETRVLEPGQKFPDINKLNDEVPRNEWVTGPSGEPRGPWQAQHLVYFLNPATMDRYTFATGTTGGAIAVRDVVDKTKWMRKFKGNCVYPIVTLSDTFMPTRFGGRQRPHFLIKRWMSLGPAEDKALPAPAPGPKPTLEHGAAAAPPPKPAPERAPMTRPTTAKEAAASAGPMPGARTVEPPTRAEELDDQIPF